MLIRATKHGEGALSSLEAPAVGPTTEETCAARRLSASRVVKAFKVSRPHHFFSEAITAADGDAK